MTHSPKRKIWAGALAALLALFAAVVVVATPAKAAAANIPGGTEIFGAANATEAFGSSNVTVKDGVITLKTNAEGYALQKPITFASGTWTLDLNGQTISTTNQAWPVGSGGTYPNSMIQVASGANVTIVGNGGTIQSSFEEGSGDGWCVLSVKGTCSVSDVNLNGGDPDAGGTPTTSMAVVSVLGEGNLTLGDDAIVSANCGETGEDGTVAVYAADSSNLVVDGATINASPANDESAPYSTGAGIQVGSSKGASDVTVTIKSGTINANQGIWVDNTCDLTVDGGTINLYGTSAYGINVSDCESVSPLNPNVTVNDVTITPAKDVTGASAVYVNPEFNKSNAASANATVELNNGTFNAPIAASNSTASGAGVDVTVNGGTYSDPVKPSLLGNNVGAMGVDKKGNVTYYNNISQVPSTQIGTEITNSPVTITAEGVLAKGSEDVTNALTALDLTSEQIKNITSGMPTDGSVLWAVWTADDPSSAKVNFIDPNDSATAAVANTNIKSQGTVGIAWVLLGAGASSNIANAPAGTWEIQIVSGGKQYTTNVSVAALTLYNPAEAVATATPTSTAAVTYYEVSNEPVEDVPASVQQVKAGGLTPVGYYELTPSTSGTKTTYTAALWDGNEYTPSTATMTYLMAGYTAVPDEGVTATLSVAPQNVLNTVGAKATLTLTIGKDALGGDIVLAKPAGMNNITNESSLTASEDAVAQAVANVVATDGKLNTTNVVSAFNTSATNWSNTVTGLASSNVALAEVDEGASNPVVSGNTVTATLDVTTSGVANPDSDTNPIAMTITISPLTIKGTVSGTQDAPTLEQPAATFSLFKGLPANKLTVIGNGTVTQTVDSKGNITLTAVPNEGGTFVGWQIGSLSQMLTGTTYTIMADQIADGMDSITAYFEGGVPTPPAPATDTVDVTRLYNPYLNGAHLLSASASEVATLKAAGWTVEGTAFTEYATKDANGGQVVPVYRLYNPYNGDHFFTASNAEAETMKAGGWQREGTAWYAPVNSNVGVTRLYNPYMTENAGLGNHLWSANYSEVSPLLGVGWKDEGRAWFAVSA